MAHEDENGERILSNEAKCHDQNVAQGIHDSCSDEKQTTMQAQQSTRRRSEIVFEDCEPQCINQGSVFIRHVILNLERQGMLYFLCIYRLVAAMQRKRIGQEDLRPFGGEQSELRRRKISLMYEICTELYNLSIDGDYKHVPCTIQNRTKAADGVYLEILSSCTRTQLSTYDCVYHSSNNGVHVIGIVVGDNNEFGFTGITVLVLDWFQHYKGNEETFRFGSLRNEMSQLAALSQMETPASKLTKTLSAFLKDDADAKWRIVHERMNNPMPISERDLQSTRCSIADSYVTALHDKNVLNEQQASIVRRALAICESWMTTKDSERAELNRFFLVSGVPGCGKTHTAVYMIAAFLLYFNNEFLRSDGIPYWNGQVLVLTKTNKALDVFLERLHRVEMPSSQDGLTWTTRAISCYCKRSATYLRRERTPTHLRKGKTDHYEKIKDVPLAMSTFGSLPNLFRQFTSSYGSATEVQDWVSKYLKAVIIDEGSQSVMTDLSHFITLFPTFNGVFIIEGDEDQMGPVVLSTITEVRNYLCWSLFTDFTFNSSSTGYIIPHAEMKIQYRMVKTMMDIANDVVYRGRMIYGPSKESHNFKNMPHELRISLNTGAYYFFNFKPVVMYTTSGAGLDIFQCVDYVNIDEIRLALTIVIGMSVNDRSNTMDVTFLSPYKEQCLEMKECLSREGLNIGGVHTVASYQGKESSVIIYSLVRRNGSRVGFLEDKQMMSVALTRAKDRLIMIGDLSYYKDAVRTTTLWKDLSTAYETHHIDIIAAENYINLSNVILDI